MNSSLMPSYLDPDIFVNNISCTLYREHLENLYFTCKSMYKQLYKSGGYIYKKICLHHQPHSIDDLPAVIYSNGDQEWYKEGKRHRGGDLPAVIYATGSHAWYKEGRFHRDGDLPAIIFATGDQEWHKEGKLHRDGDLPARIKEDGTLYWYKEGNRYI
jgi:hypothetical protein